MNSIHKVGLTLIAFIMIFFLSFAAIIANERKAIAQIPDVTPWGNYHTQVLLDAGNRGPAFFNVVTQYLNTLPENDRRTAARFMVKQLGHGDRTDLEAGPSHPENYVKLQRILDKHFVNAADLMQGIRQNAVEKPEED